MLMEFWRLLFDVITKKILFLTMDTTIMKFVSTDALHFFSDNKVLLSLVMGLGLSACCGFRVFVPLLAASIATKMGILHLGAWLSMDGQHGSHDLFWRSYYF